ncbi:acyltransferase [Enterococcus gallinarum]|uniref:acyltransferase family protein n=1 Tax=Enterococcus gallinarum TaxID=1353 RepID=UPI001157A824|nr:acyltransferase family protein [Enterococcus gallinarum]MEB5881597.1 acyltransferase [Enterococcus gallinarum]
MTQRINRLSNFELLRLVSMFLIVLHHYGVHGLVNETGSSLQSVGVGMLSSLGKSGVFLFVLIGSFFLVDKSFNCSRIINIISSTFFYSFLILFLGLALFRNQITSMQIIRSIFFVPLNYWFVTDYIFLLIIIPFLNLLVKNLSRKKFETLLMIGLVFLFVFPTIFSSASEYSNIDIFAFLYCVAMYLKKYNVFSKWSQCKIGIIMIFLFFSIVLSVYVISLYPNVVKYLNINTLFLTRTNSVLTLLFSLVCFLFFKGWNLRYNSAINFASKATLGIYLIHDNPIIRSLLWKAINNQQYHGLSETIIAGLFVSLLVYTCCLIIELIRIMCLNKVIEKVFLWIIPLDVRNKIDSQFK